MGFEGVFGSISDVFSQLINFITGLFSGLFDTLSGFGGNLLG